MNNKHETLWLLKKCTLYILCTLILSNPFYLTIRSSLTLIQNELEFQNVIIHIKFYFSLCLGFPKDVIKILVYYIPIIFFT
jgi:hypothetical protein